MSIRLVTDKENVDYQAVADILDHFGLSHFDAATEEKIFKNSYATAFIYDVDQVVGCARAISDGVCQAAIYNVALLEGYQGQQLGRKLIDSLLEQVKGCNVILYTHPKTVSMYEKMGFRRQKTGMAIYNGNAESLKWMEDTGFLLEEGYRFGDNYYERRLANQRYLFGDRLTESDVRLYVTLVRFDCAYYPVFRLNKKLLRDYPNLWAYARDLYQTPGFGDTTNFAAIKKHYHIDCCPSNEFAIVPNGPDESLWLTPHGREKLSGK